MSGPDVVSVVRAMSEANVQFVVVGEPAAGSPMRVVVSRHPTNLDALGRALDQLDSSVRVPGATTGDATAPAQAPLVPRRIGDPLGTIALSTSAGDVDLMFGGPRRSLYTEAALGAEVRELGGVRVQWVNALRDPGPVARSTSRMLGRRLLSIAEGLANLIDRREDGASGKRGGDGEDCEGDDGDRD